MLRAYSPKSTISRVNAIVLITPHTRSMVVLNCRFILDLREAAAKVQDDTQLTRTTAQDMSDISIAFRPSGSETTTVISSVYGATVYWASREPPSTIPLDDTSEIGLPERREQV